MASTLRTKAGPLLDYTVYSLYHESPQYFTRSAEVKKVPQFNKRHGFDAPPLAHVGAEGTVSAAQRSFSALGWRDVGTKAGSCKVLILTKLRRTSIEVYALARRTANSSGQPPIQYRPKHISAVRRLQVQPPTVSKTQDSAKMKS